MRLSSGEQTELLEFIYQMLKQKDPKQMTIQEHFILMRAQRLDRDHVLVSSREHCSDCGKAYSHFEGCRMCEDCGLCGPDITKKESMTLARVRRLATQARKEANA